MILQLLETDDILSNSLAGQDVSPRCFLPAVTGVLPDYILIQRPPPSLYSFSKSSRKCVVSRRVSLWFSNIPLGIITKMWTNIHQHRHQHQHQHQRQRHHDSISASQQSPTNDGPCLLSRLPAHFHAVTRGQPATQLQYCFTKYMNQFLSLFFGLTSSSQRSTRIHVHWIVAVHIR